MRSLAPRYLVAIAAFVVALSCGDVPTFPGGIAFIGPVLLPSPAIATLDTLRDSVGQVAPLRVEAFDINNNVILNVPVTFVVSSVPPGVKIDANGIVTAFDSIQQVQIVGRVGDRLQTTPVNLFVVTQPDRIEQSAALDSLVPVVKSSPLSVKVSGLRRGTRIPVQGIIVHYQIIKVNNSTGVDSSLFTLVDDINEPVTGDPRTAVDTTDAAGIASRFLISANTVGVDSVVVAANATNLKGVSLAGSPVRFVIPVKKGRSP